MSCPLNKEKSCQVCEFMKESLCDFPFIGSLNVRELKADLQFVQCESCGLVTKSKDAFSHSVNTGHNKWELIGGE